MEPTPRPTLRVEDSFFLALVVVVSIAFALVIEPFFAPILWSVIAAILFMPVNRRLLAAMPGRPGGAAGLTLLRIIALVIIPAILLAVALTQEVSVFYARIQSGEIDFAVLFARLQDSLPRWMANYLDRYGLTDFDALQARLNAALASSFRTLAAQAVLIGQSAFG
ncbi:MAG: AI-2E family transporter, partial [Sphingomonadales bacterium]|nr:AI-2E family transporter [Sphingomonadales bacterium]